MSKIAQEVQVSKETYELARGLANIVAASKLALNDGWQPGQDIPAILASSVAELGTMVQGMDQIDDEIKEDAKAFADALYLGLRDIPFLFIGSNGTSS